jgi:hypothetical protein
MRSGPHPSWFFFSIYTQAICEWLYCCHQKNNFVPIVIRDPASFFPASYKSLPTIDFNSWWRLFFQRCWELSTSAKNTIIEMVKSGFSRCKISDVLKIPRSTVIGVAHKFLGYLLNFCWSGSFMSRSKIIFSM